MKISAHWLKKFVKLDQSDQILGEKLTLHTAELEEIIAIGDHFTRVFWGQLTSVAKHPKSDKLHVGQFDLGTQDEKQIVFGSVHPLEIGQIVPLALDGAGLLSGIEIKNTEVRGQKSEGMVCDNRELGWSFEGLLTEADPKLLGQNLTKYSPFLADNLFDIDNKSLTHRPDLMGHRGFARELATIFDAKLTLPEPVVSLPESGKSIGLQIKTDGCRRFCAMEIDNITVKSSSLDQQILLENLDTRAINNTVDITNLVMLEYGQPMHAFDGEKITGDIIVRQAKDGEEITTLDGKSYTLSSEDMVVADETRALSIAGVMGGLDSSVTEGTTRIVFEAANWDPVRVRKTSQRLGIRTESSGRYEKSLDPEICRTAILAASQLALESCEEAQISSDLTDQYPIKFPEKTIKLSVEKTQKVIGHPIPRAAMVKTLSQLGFGVEEAAGENLTVKVPSFRATKDVFIPEDLIEEIVRLHGFENLESQLPTLPLEMPRVNPLRSLDWRTRDFWSSNQYLEVYNHSFYKFETPPPNAVGIQNPLSDEYEFLRTSLIEPMLRDLKPELRQHGRLDFFELGRTYLYENKEDVRPIETPQLLVFSAQIGGKAEPLFFEVKAKLERYFQTLGLSVTTTPIQEAGDFQHPAQSAELWVGNKSVGHLSVLHPKHNPDKKAVVVFAEINLESLLKEQGDQSSYQKLIQYPSVHRDLSVILPRTATFGQAKALIEDISPLVESVELFDEYQDDEKLGESVKNLAFHLRFRSSEKTLEDTEIETVFEQIVQQLGTKLDAQLRMAFDQQ